MLDEQCEKLAYDQLLSYVNLLKTTKPLKLTFDQAQSLTTKQLGSLALSKEQSKACGGAETAQVRLKNYTSLERNWPTISQACWLLVTARLFTDRLTAIDDRVIILGLLLLNE